MKNSRLARLDFEALKQAVLTRLLKVGLELGLKTIYGKLQQIFMEKR